MARPERIVAAALVVLVVSLLVVGVVSRTPLRHVVQVLPAIVALGLAVGRRPWSRFAAMAVFGFWLFVMTLIWLFLLGLARVVTGRFTQVEIALTLAIGVASVVGIVAAIRARDSSSWRTRVVVFVVAAALQFGAVLLSVQPMLENR